VRHLAHGLRRAAPDPDEIVIHIGGDDELDGPLPASLCQAGR
jgi:hypothetical protein